MQAINRGSVDPPFHRRNFVTILHDFVQARVRGKAFLFDTDGTLIDSHGIVEDIWRRWASRHCLDSEAVLAKAHGRQAAETVRLFAPAGTDTIEEAAWIHRLAARETYGINPTRAHAFSGSANASCGTVNAVVRGRGPEVRPNDALLKQWGIGSTPEGGPLSGPML